MRIRTSIVMAAVVTLAVVLTYFSLRVGLRHRTERGIDLMAVRRAQQLSLQDVDKVLIVFNDGDRALRLFPKHDADDISAILTAIKHCTVDTREVSNNESDYLTIYSQRKGGLTIYATFAPAAAPVVSAILRSDDLSRIVQDIVRRHNVKQESGRRMLPATGLRTVVKGKSDADIAKILVVSPWQKAPTEVTDRADIRAFVEGMRTAVIPTPQCGCDGPQVVVVWKNGSKSQPFGFDIEHGPSHAYGKAFAEAYNRVAEPDRRVKLN